MLAVVVRTPGDPDNLVIHDIPKPCPSAHQVLIRVAAAGLNRADLLQRKGLYPPPQGASPILGMEVSGVVEAIGAEIKRWEIGDKVCALITGGGYAEYVVAYEDECLPIPINISFLEAAALPEAVTTVWANIFLSGHLQKQETILVHGGASGIGTTAIQMIKAFGAKIFVTVGSEIKKEACLKLGADLVINYRQSDFVLEVLAATEKKGVDLVLDIVGGSYVSRNLSVLRQGGRHLSLATQENKLATIDLREIMMKRLILTGSTLRGRLPAEKAHLRQSIENNVWPWIHENKLKPLIYKVLPIKNASEAHKMMESGQHIGKIVLEVAAL